MEGLAVERRILGSRFGNARGYIEGDREMNSGRAAASAKRKAYTHIILPAFIGGLIAYIDRVNISFAALTMNHDLGFTAQIFGMGAGIFFFGYFLFEVPGALVAAKYSTRWWLARIMISWGIVSLSFAFIRTPTQFYITRFLLGACEASYMPVIQACVIPRWFNARERARVISVFVASMQCAGIVGAPLAGWLLGLELFGLKGWRVLFIMEAIPALVFGVILIYWMADWPRDAKWLDSEEKAALVEEYEREVAVKTFVKKYTVWQALKDPTVLKFYLIYFLWITGFWGFTYWMPTVLKSVSGWSNLTVGLMSAIPMMISLVAMMLIGHSSAVTGERRWHTTLCMFIAALGMGVGVFITAPWLSFIFICLTAIGVYGAFGVWFTLPTTFLSGTAVAGALAMMNSIGNLGGFFGPYITGWIKGATGSFVYAYLYLAASLTLAGVLILTIKKRMPTDVLRDEEPVSTSVGNTASAL